MKWKERINIMAGFAFSACFNRTIHYRDRLRLVCFLIASTS